MDTMDIELRVDKTLVARLIENALHGAGLQLTAPGPAGVPRIGQPWPGIEGSLYAGIARGAEADHHLILLDGDAEDVSWTRAKEWAAEQGGELPTRSEQALLYANLKDQFKERYYWSGEDYAPYDVYAWSQGFILGNQSCTRKLSGYRARAVRRVVIASAI